MFTYNVPFETIIGLKSTNPIVRFLNENLNDKSKIAIIFEKINDELPANLAKVLSDLKKKRPDIKYELEEFLSHIKIDSKKLNNANAIIICGTHQLVDAVNKLDFDCDIPLVFLASETANMDVLNATYIEKRKLHCCKFIRTIVADNSISMFDPDLFTFKSYDWMFSLSTLNLLTNKNLNPIHRVNYASCVNFFAQYLTHNDLNIFKKGIACFYNAFNNDLNNPIYKSILKKSHNWKEFKNYSVLKLEKYRINFKSKDLANLLNRFNISPTEFEKTIKYFIHIQGGK